MSALIVVRHHSQNRCPKPVLENQQSTKSEAMSGKIVVRYHSQNQRCPPLLSNQQSTKSDIVLRHHSLNRRSPSVLPNQQSTRSQATTEQIVLRYHSQNRRQPLLANQHSKKTHKSRLAEVAGQTTAGCAALCCCCPCGLVNLFVIAVYKLPAGLCKKALKKKKEHSFKQGLLPRGGDEGTQLQPISIDLWPLEKPNEDNPMATKEINDLENEMWERFSSTGFFRSPSRRD